jgi:dTDP-4-dehydrorhamnose reductase
MRPEGCGRQRVILVTGGGGLIGGALVARLRSEGHEVWAPSRSKRNSAGLDLDQPNNGTFPEAIQTAFLSAWRGGVVEAAQDEWATWRTNVEGNLALIKRLREQSVNMVFLSTSLVFAGTETSAHAPLSPCCYYAEQKAAIEAALDPHKDVIVRMTKVGETLLPRLRQWAASLRAGGSIAVARGLRLAPVLLDEAVDGLAGLARDHLPGIYQMSALRDHSYFDLAASLSSVVGGVVADDPDAGKDVFRPIPVSGRLTICSPVGSSAWPTGEDRAQLLVERALS